MFESIPQEMREYRQWVVWKLEAREGTKDTKVPYSPNSNRKADVNTPKTWGTWDEAITAFNTGNFTGIGFVLTSSDPYGFIDLDNTYDDQVALDRQIKIFREFNSYSEISPSGGGLHIIVKGKVPHGRRRASIEVYSDQRYMTMTGNVYNPVKIEQRQDLLTLLWEQMGGPPTVYTYGEDQEQKLTDEQVLEIAFNASNGDKAKALFDGNWQSMYPSQSEADFALVDILAYYTQNKQQIARLFRQSVLGSREKAKRNNYIAYMVNKSFDRQLPPVDIDGIRIQIDNLVKGNARGEPGGTPLAPVSQAPLTVVANQEASNAYANTGLFPPGLVGEVAQFILDAAPRPVPEIALAGSIALLSGITGRAYNVSKTGLNQYILVISETGTGKEAVANGIGKLMAAIKSQVPASAEFIGPGELVSPAGLIKWMQKYPAILTMIGEFGLKLKEMSSPMANTNMQGLKRILLDLFNKSGHGQVYNPMAYSDPNKNTSVINSPSLTIFGECTPKTLYENLDEAMIAEGLLPRFMLVEYLGERVPSSKTFQTVQPNFQLVDKLAQLTAQCLSNSHNGVVQEIAMDRDAEALFDAFDKWCDAQINGSRDEVTRQLWNRAHIKSLKLAALFAVGMNYVNPKIIYAEALRATTDVADQIKKLAGKFDAGEVGVVSNDEVKQAKDVNRVICDYLYKPYSPTMEKYGVTEQMHRDKVIPYVYIQRRLVSAASFRKDKVGATIAIKRAIQVFLDAGELAEISKNQSNKSWGKDAKAYAILDPKAFPPG